MPLPADNPSSAAIWTRNEEYISWRDCPHGAAETERQPCLITGLTNGTQGWWSTDWGGTADWGSGSLVAWGVGSRGMPKPQTVENGNNEIVFGLNAPPLCLSCHCLPRPLS